MTGTVEQDGLREVLSDVHVYSRYDLLPDNCHAISRLKFSFPILSKTRTTKPESEVVRTENKHEEVCQSGDDCSCTPSKKRRTKDQSTDDGDDYDEKDNDDDEDPILCRRIDDSTEGQSDIVENSDDHDRRFSITIKHSLVTELGQVGEQVWLGALLLCDYILYNRGQFTDVSVLDLGAGTGLTSIVAAMFADKVYCTDVGENVLKLAQCNINRRHDLPADTNDPCAAVLVRELDWFSSGDIGTGRCQQNQSEFHFTVSELKDLQTVSILLAADVIYDDDITDAFFNTVKLLMGNPPTKTLFLSLEKRLVFTLKDLDVASPGYEHFSQCLSDLSRSEGRPVYHVEQIKTDFQQYFLYNRVKQLELWKISTDFNGG